MASVNLFVFSLSTPFFLLPLLYAPCSCFVEHLLPIFIRGYLFYSCDSPKYHRLTGSLLLLKRDEQSWIGFKSSFTFFLRLFVVFPHLFFLSRITDEIAACILPISATPPQNRILFISSNRWCCQRIIYFCLLFQMIFNAIVAADHGVFDVPFGWCKSRSLFLWLLLNCLQSRVNFMWEMAMTYKNCYSWEFTLTFILRKITQVVIF